MARKKQQDTSAKQKAFHATPFRDLKGVAVSPSSPRKREAPQPVVKSSARVEEDDGLFLQAMGGVRRLDSSQRITATAGMEKNPSRRAAVPVRREEEEPAEREEFAQALEQLKLDVIFTDKFPEDDELKPLGANRLRQMKKGVIRVDRQLDLHGLTREEALDALPWFVRNARAHGEKAVLIITGKGYNSPGEPVLQQAVAAWLRDAGKEFVVEFAPAPREMGGSGALVLFLRG